MLKNMIKKYKQKRLENAYGKEYEDIESKMECVWGIKSCDELLSGDEATLWTMNDFDITYLKDEHKYILGVETIYCFENKKNEVKYITKILNAFTKWKNDNGYDTTQVPDIYDVFTQGININSHFDSIEEAYGAFKFLVTGYIEANHVM